MYAHNCANHGNRAGPIAKDLVLACRRYGLETKEMFEVASQWKKRKRGLVFGLFRPECQLTTPSLQN